MKLSAVLLLLSAISCGQSLKIGDPAPPLLLERTIPSGLNTAWDALRGKPVVIEFWGTWCAGCVEEIPHLNELVSQFPDVRFLSITDETADIVEPFLVRRPIQGWVGFDRDQATFKAYGAEFRPQTMLVDKNGILRALLRPRQVTAEVMNAFLAGRPVILPGALSLSLHFFDDQTNDPMYAVLLRPSASPRTSRMGYIDPGRLEGIGLTLKTLIAWAWSFESSRLEGPEDLLATRWDFCVSLPRGLSGELALFRDLLERNFQLKIRRETRDIDALVLSAAHHKLRESPKGVTMKNLASMLAYKLKRQVVDETGLDKRYDFEYPSNLDGIEDFVRIQLGLDLTPAKRPIEFLVIDSLELPSYRTSR